MNNELDGFQIGIDPDGKIRKVPASEEPSMVKLKNVLMAQITQAINDGALPDVDNIRIDLYRNKGLGPLIMIEVRDQMDPRHFVEIMYIHAKEFQQTQGDF